MKIFRHHGIEYIEIAQDLFALAHEAKIPPGRRHHFLRTVTMRGKVPKYQMTPLITGGSRQGWVETRAWVVADGANFNNTTTETIIFPNITIPANTLADGKLLRLIAYGRHGTTGTPTLTFRARAGGVGGTQLCATGAMVCGTTVTAAMWRVEVLIQTRTNGASGTVFAVGRASIGEDATATVGSATNASAEDFMGSAGVATPSTASFDLTADQALALTGQWGTANSLNTMTGHVEVLEEMN